MKPDAYITSLLNCAVICSESGLSTPSHYLNQWWSVVTWTFSEMRLKIQLFSLKKLHSKSRLKMSFCRCFKVLKWPMNNKIRPANWLKKWINKTILREEIFSAERLLIISMNNVIRLFMLALARTIYFFLSWYMNSHSHIKGSDYDISTLKIE